MLDMEHTGSKEYVIPILRNAQRLRTLTENILHLAKMESQTLKLNKEQFCLGEAISLVVQDTSTKVVVMMEKNQMCIVLVVTGENGLMKTIALLLKQTEEE
jgi:signal transduction histidine kinase